MNELLLIGSLIVLYGAELLWFYLFGTGGLLAFTLSLDDFVITFFNAGVGTTTLPLFVYGMLKQRVPPEINAISALMILASILLVGGSLILQRRGSRG